MKPDWRKLIKPALKPANGKYVMRDIYERIANRTAIVYQTEKSAAVLWRDSYPQYDVMVIAFAGGELEDMLEHMEPMKNQARMWGCQAIEVVGRPGWKKVLREYGFKNPSITMSLEV